MNSTRIIMVTSCKGGVGKSTVSANLAIKLALDGWRTLLIDCDFGVRSLDLIMGLEDRVIFDITDIILHDIAPEKAIIQDSRSENLYFCAAPYDYETDLDHDQFKAALRSIGAQMNFDYIIIDTPGDTGSPLRLAAAASDEALVVSTYQPASIRAAERTGILLEESGVKIRKLIINCFHSDGKEFEGQPGLLEVIDKTSIQLLGIIPYDSRLSDKQAQGEDVFTIPSCNAAEAFTNIAIRLTGRTVPLFTGFKKIKRAELIKKIQGSDQGKDGYTMEIAIIAGESKKELMTQFCIAYCGILANHNLCATGTTHKHITEATGLRIEKLLSGPQGGVEQITTRVAYDEIDLVLFFRDYAENDSMAERNNLNLLKLCDIHNVPVATNIATAEILVRALERGDIDWREIVNPRSEYNLRKKSQNYSK